jgi:hypothetical protein
MAQLSKQDLEEIIERDMPGYALAYEAPPHAGDRPAAVAPDEVGPDIAVLREKFLGEQPAGAGDAAVATPPDSDDQIVAVRPKDSSDPFDHGGRPKTVVVSGRDRRVVGRQG